MVCLEPSTALTPTGNWRFGFQSVDDWGSSLKPVACFNDARPAEKAGSIVAGESPVAALAQRITVRKDRTQETRMRCVCGNELKSGQRLRRIIGDHKTCSEC